MSLEIGEKKRVSNSNYNKKRSKFEFDVALSFASENRKIAEKIRNRLKKQGWSVFYDRDYRAHLWGKNKEEFERIYSSASRYFVPIISSHYLEKDWCRFEFDIAKEEARKRKGEFILPLRLDDSRIVGLHDDIQYIDLRQFSISEVVHDLLEKLPKHKLSKSKTQALNKLKVQILTHSNHRALGIIAVCKFPLYIEDFEKNFSSH